MNTMRVNNENKLLQAPRIVKQGFEKISNLTASRDNLKLHIFLTEDDDGCGDEEDFDDDIEDQGVGNA